MSAGEHAPDPEDMDADDLRGEVRRLRERQDKLVDLVALVAGWQPNPALFDSRELVKRSDHLDVEIEDEDKPSFPGQSGGYRP